MEIALTLTEGNAVAALAIAAGVALLLYSFVFALCGGIFTRKFEYLLYEVTRTARNCTPEYGGGHPKPTRF